MEKVHNDQKTSVLIVILFILSILDLIGLIIGDYSYSTDPFDFIILIVGYLLVIVGTYFARKRAIRKNFSGLKMAKFALFAFIFSFVINVAGSLILIPYFNSLSAFAKNETPAFFNNNFEVLKNNSTERLTSILSFPKTIEELDKKFSEVGTIKSCEQDKYNETYVNYGWDAEANGFYFELTGAYSIRCYGEDKPFDLYVSTKYKDGKWLVENYKFDTQLEQSFDTNKDNKSDED